MHCPYLVTVARREQGMAIGHVSFLNKSSRCYHHLDSSALGIVDYREEIGKTAKCAIRVKSYTVSCQFDIFEFIAGDNILLWSINTSVRVCRRV